MIWKTKLTTSLLTAVLLPSCVSSGYQDASDLNRSALYDPPTVTLIEGAEYLFKEGIFVGDGQKYHSDYSYRRAIIIGK
jgi:hypothetical protein|tara:strand:+ start:104 stop:340 length:237 start_codon:yes stop_codon:yes gene_type:complete